jgi:inosine triphosphate pyrophosphatase
MTSTSSVPQHLNFITGNKNKLAEVSHLLLPDSTKIIQFTYLIPTLTPTKVQAILANVIELRNQNVDLVEIQGTVEEVTSDKARRAAEIVRLHLFPQLYF